MKPGTLLSNIAAMLLAVYIGFAVLTPSCFAVPQKVGDTITDVVVGRNAKGPYTLSYVDFDPGSVRVVLNGRTLKKGEDYNVDAGKGLISFNAVVLNDVLVSVSYNLIPGKSKQNAGTVNVPVILNVFQRKDANVQVTGLYAQDDPRNPDATKTIVGLGGEKTWAQTKIGTQFFVSQRNDPKEDAQTGGTWERSAFKVSSETDTGKVRLTASMLHAGSEFAGGKETGLGVGKEVMSLALSTSPIKSVRFTAGMQQTEDTAGASKGNRSTIQEQNLVVTPNDATTVSLVHRTTETSTAAGSGNTVDSSAVRIDQKLAGNTNATVSFENASIETGSATDRVRTTQANISTAPIKQVSVNASLTQRDSELLGQETQQNVGVTIKPVDQVTVTAAHSAVENASGEKTKTDISLKASPLRNTELTGNVALRTNNAEERFQHDLRLTTKPVEFVKFTAGFAQSGVNENDNVTKSASLELTPFAHTQISAGYIYAEDGSRIMTVRDYAAVSKPWRFVTFSGKLRDREARNDEAVDTKAVQVALSPFDRFVLTGAYQSNPEDTRGLVQLYNATNLGLRVRLGTVGLTTDYCSKEEYTFNRLSDERRFGLDVPVFRNGKLTTGVKLARFLDGSELATRTYSLGYTHNVGSTFNLSLTGYFTDYRQNKVTLPEKSEYSAEASLGIKF